jgi:CelD/BcsL family acetyltransferase involved in cellulose biosynthesis
VCKSRFLYSEDSVSNKNTEIKLDKEGKREVKQQNENKRKKERKKERTTDEIGNENEIIAVVGNRNKLSNNLLLVYSFPQP